MNKFSDQWLGHQYCDICGFEKPNVLIDGRTTDGPWALMCGNCFDIYGAGLGTGLGQKYVKQGDKYIKVEG